MKIAFFELEGWEEKLIRGVFPNEEISFLKDKVTELSLPEQKNFEVISTFVGSRLTKEVIDIFPNLKCISTRSTGYDHIDFQTTSARGIPILYVPGYGDNTVAEFAFGLILALTRKIYQGIDQIKETGSFALQGLRGIDLKGKTLGIVGTGRIGREATKIGTGFGMKVIACDSFPDQQFAASAGIEYVSLDEVLSRSDIISLHCPYNKDTHHLINKNNIGRVKRGAYLVNTARGPIVETAALIDALENETLAGVGLDVLEEEGETKDELLTLTMGHPKNEELKMMLQNHILMKMPNVLITPHNAFNSQEAMERILSITLWNIKSFIEGKPVNVVK